MAWLVLVALGADDARYVRFYESTRFAPARADSEPAQRVVELLKDREHWIGAYRAIEEKYGGLPDDLKVSVDFEYEGAEVARGAGRGQEGRVSFNLKQLEKYQEQIDDVDRQRKELARQGRRITYRIPPVRFERIIYHELVHVFQRGYDAPDWFNEGMAQLLAEDMNAMTAFAVAGRTVEPIDTGLSETNDIYARGHAFWKWLASRGVAKRVVEASVVERRPWKEALETATNLSWPMIVTAEREWSAREIAKLRPKE